MYGTSEYLLRIGLEYSNINSGFGFVALPKMKMGTFELKEKMNYHL